MFYLEKLRKKNILEIKKTYFAPHNVKLIIFDTQNPIIHAWKS